MQSNILSTIENNRLDVISNIDPSHKSSNGQFMTPVSIGMMMADLFDTPTNKNIRLLDPGAGTGILIFSFIDMLLRKRIFPKSIDVLAFENDEYLAKQLEKNASIATKDYKQQGLNVNINVNEVDFISEGTKLIKPTFDSPNPDFKPFTHVIANPPYLKISSSSKERKTLSEIGLQVNNLYSAFIGLSISLLEKGGHLVAITPRSFCNGPYFSPFRNFLLNECSFRSIHLFQSRDSAFKEDDVLQENIIYYLRKGVKESKVCISVSRGRSFTDIKSRTVPHSDIVNVNDRDRIIRIPVNKFDDYVLERMSILPCYLSSLGLNVSTGPVVDFRVKKSIFDEAKNGCVPLIYPSHFKKQSIQWPISKEIKPNAISVNASTRNWLFPNDHYVLIKRFSSKEERRRIYPALYNPIVNYKKIAFENHLNVLHSSKSGIDINVAEGLVSYLSSSIVDLFFRQFSGHTQVNASDLRSFPFPDHRTIMELSKFYKNGHVITQNVDDYLENLFVSRYSITSPDPIVLAEKTSP